MSEGTSASSLPANVSKKRKRQAEESSQQIKEAAPAHASGGPSKKRRKRSKNKPAAEDVGNDDRGSGIDESIRKMDGRLLADYFGQKAKRHNKELTAMELNDLYVPEHAFLDTSSFEQSRTLNQLPTFLKTYSPNNGSGLSESSERNGTPHTLVVASAALRAADLVRSLRLFQTKGTTVGKLFAKHIKLEEAKQFLQRARIGIGVGTPVRLIDLIESGALKLEALERIVIDGSYIDQKKRGIFDMKETHFPLLQLLTRPELRERYGAEKNGVKILVF